MTKTSYWLTFTFLCFCSIKRKLKMIIFWSWQFPSSIFHSFDLADCSLSYKIIATETQLIGNRWRDHGRSRCKAWAWSSLVKEESLDSSSDLTDWTFASPNLSAILDPIFQSDKIWKTSVDICCLKHVLLFSLFLWGGTIRNIGMIFGAIF